MTKISTYTFADNHFEKEFYVLEGIVSALNFSDEVIYVDGKSCDGTYELTKTMEKIDNRIKVFQLPYNDKGMRKHATMALKNAALMQCTGDWCILMDGDEVYHEEDAKTIRSYAEKYDDSDIKAIEFNTLHFYRDFSYINNNPEWYKKKVYMFKNGWGFHHGLVGNDPDQIVCFNGDPPVKKVTAPVKVYHYGHVRDWDLYQRLKNVQHQRHHPMAWEKYKIKEWDERFLQLYKGTHPKIMKIRIEKKLPRLCISHILSELSEQLKRHASWKYLYEKGYSPLIPSTEKEKY